MAAFSVKKGLVLAAWLSVFCVHGYGFGLGIPWGKKDHNNLTEANGQEAPSPVPDRDAQTSGNNFKEYHISDEDRERVDSVIAQLVDSLGNGTKAADSTREAATEFYRGFFYGKLKSTYSHGNFFTPNGDRLLLSVTRDKGDRKEEHGRDSNGSDAETLHKGWGGGRNSDTGLLSVQLSDGGTVFLSGTLMPAKHILLSSLYRVYRRVYTSVENGFRLAASFPIRKGDDDKEFTISPMAVWGGKKLSHEGLGDEDRDRVDPIIALLANHLSHNAKDAESAMEQAAAFYHSCFYGSASERQGRNMTLPNGDSLRVSATWLQKDRKGRKNREQQGDESRGQAEAEEFHEGWGGGRDSDTGLINILLSDGDVVLLSGRVVPVKRAAWARVVPAKRSTWLTPCYV